MYFTWPAGRVVSVAVDGWAAITSSDDASFDCLGRMTESTKWVGAEVELIVVELTVEVFVSEPFVRFEPLSLSAGITMTISVWLLGWLESVAAVGDTVSARTPVALARKQ